LFYKELAGCHLVGGLPWQPLSTERLEISTDPSVRLSLRTRVLERVMIRVSGDDLQLALAETECVAGDIKLTA
jgi:hypothetical protein